MVTTNSSAQNRVLGLAPGDIIGERYEIVRVLGVGGTGAVFEARHRTIGRTVAVKLLLPEIASNPVVAQRFLQEARTANEVRHKNIVEVLDFGEDQGRLYMVMEFLRGESFADFIVREAPLSPRAIIRALEPIMSALTAAHARGIVHRDVKPQNLFLATTDGEEEPVPKLIDFGIAKRIVGGDINLTSTGMILGTPAYMSPEQARADREITQAADQYSLGVIIYQALTGRIPYEADSYPAMLIQIVSQAPNDIRAHRPDLPNGLATVVMRALARDPAQRFASLADLREALKPWRDDDDVGRTLVTHTRPEASALTRPDGTPAVDPPTIPLALAPRRPAPVDETPTLPSAPVSDSRLRSVAFGVGVLALSTVGLAIYLATRAVPEGPVTASTAPPSAPPTALPTEPPTDAQETITLRLDVEPPTAEISLDGAFIGHGHAEVLRPRDGRRLQLRLSAPGYAAVTDVLTANGDARVSRVLVALAPSGLGTAPPVGPLGSRVARTPFVQTTQPTPITPQIAPQIAPPARNPTYGGREHPHIDPTNPF